jgi:hypothetical protein
VMKKEERKRKALLEAEKRKALLHKHFLASLAVTSSWLRESSMVQRRLMMVDAVCRASMHMFSLSLSCDMWRFKRPSKSESERQWQWCCAHVGIAYNVFLRTSMLDWSENLKDPRQNSDKQNSHGNLEAEQQKLKEEEEWRQKLRTQGR